MNSVARSPSSGAGRLAKSMPTSFPVILIPSTSSSATMHYMSDILSYRPGGVRIWRRQAVTPRGEAMLTSSDLVAFAAATDLRRARAFYEQALGLTVTGHTDFACVFDANGTMLRVTAVPEVSSAGYTVLGWRVTDIAAAVRELMAKGVVF